MSDTEIVEEPLPDELPVEEPEAEEEAPPEEAQDGDEESSEETAAEATDGEDVAEEPAPKKRRSAQKRISELTRARHTAEREAQQYKQQLDALQANATPAAEPKQEDFPSYDEFVLARAEYRAEQTVTKKLENLGKVAQENQSQAEQTARAADWEVKVEDARDKYDDFDEVVMSPDNTFFTDTLFAALSEEENGTDVAYHLASNPKLGRELASLSPMKAVLRIGKLSAKLAEKPTRKQTGAPTPVKTVNSGSAPQGLTPYTAKTMAEYAKARKAQEAGQT